MAFRRKLDSSSGDVFKFEKVGQKLVGFYLGSFDHDGDYGPTKKHVFKTPKGMKVVFGQKHLTDLLTEGENVVGKLLEVAYIGDKPPAKGRKGNPMKLFELGIDDEQVLDADEIPDAADMAEESTDEYAAAEEDETEEAPEVEEEEEPMDEVKTAPARSIATSKAGAAAAKARALDLINRKNVKTS